MKEFRSIVYLGLALGMLIYAVTRLEIGQGLTLPTIFGVIWIGFALLIVAAHLHQILGVDEETKEELARVKKLKRWQMEQAFRGKAKLFQTRK